MSFWQLLFIIVSGSSIAIIGIFFLESEYRRQKLIKTEDLLFSLANKKGLFSKKHAFIRNDELQLFHLLEQIAGDRYYVFPQVHFSELIDVANGNKDHDDLYLKLGEKHVDFAIFDKQLLSPKAVVELNGEYHFRASQKNKDEFRKDLFESVGIKFIPIPKAATYSLDGLKEQILPCLTT